VARRRRPPWPAVARQIPIVAGRLGLIALELVEQRLDAVDGGEHKRDGLAGDRPAAAEISHQRFGGVGQRLEPRQAEEAAGALDGVDQPKNIVEDLGVVRLLLETHELNVDDVEAFAGFGQEIPQQLVHRTRTLDATRKAPSWRPSWGPNRRLWEAMPVCWETV
jgi:hypothetical protein